MPTYSDPYDVFERIAGDERRARTAAAAEQARVEGEHEARRAAEAKAKSTELSLRVNERHRLAEFRYHGVEPPVIGGVPTKTSFHLLRSLGWTVEEAFGQRQMVAPRSVPQQPGKSREDYDQDT
jgi:hypothetical protein